MMVPIAWALSVILATAAAAEPEPAPAPDAKTARPTIALYPLTSRGAAAPEVLQQIEAAIRTELTETVGAIVPPNPEPSSSSSAPTPTKRCSAEEIPCLAAFGRAASATEVIAGEVVSIADSYAVTLRLVDVACEKVVASASANVNRDVEEMVWATRAQVARLKTPDRFAGQLAFAGAPGATLEVGGRTMASPVVVTRPGSREVRIQVGTRIIEGWVEVRYAHTATVSIDLARSKLIVRYSPWQPPPNAMSVELADKPPRAETAAAGGLQPSQPASTDADSAKDGSTGPSASFKRWPGYVAIGVGAAMLVGGTVLELRAASVRREIESLRLPDGAFPASKRSTVLQKADQFGNLKTGGWVLLGVGAAGALGGGTYLLFGPSIFGGETISAGVTY